MRVYNYIYTYIYTLNDRVEALVELSTLYTDIGASYLAWIRILEYCTFIHMAKLMI